MKYIKIYENLFGGIFDTNKTRLPLVLESHIDFLKKYVADKDWDNADKMYNILTNDIWQTTDDSTAFDKKVDELNKIYPRRHNREKSKPDMEKTRYDLLFEPSGEVMEINDKELDVINDVIEISYNKELDAFILDDKQRYIITFLLKK